MARIAMVADEVLPTNALLVTLFTADFATANCMDRFLCGVHAAVSDVNGDYQLFDRFKDYVFSEEAKMEAKLEMVMYCLDAVNTLDLVTNAGRLEKVCWAAFVHASRCADYRCLPSICYLSSTSCCVAHSA